MSREVRRVPVDWKHPVEPNPYWREQHLSRRFRGEAEPRLHAPEEQFVSLAADYAAAHESWENDGTELRARTGFEWRFHVEYCLTGYQGRNDSGPTIHKFEGHAGIVDVRDEDHLLELLLVDHAAAEPDPSQYMPVFEGDPETFGWCLYQTVSEGTPVTPVFATAGELIDHLATVGQDWDQEPMRLAAAEALVSAGGSLGSFVAVGGRLLDSTKDADVVAGLGEQVTS